MKGQRKSFEKAANVSASSIEGANEKHSLNENGNQQDIQNNAGYNTSKKALEQQSKNKKEPTKRDTSADPLYDNPQVQEMINFSRNFVLVDQDPGPPGDLKRQTSRSTENLSTFTTVVPKRQKWKKKSPSTDADIQSLTGGGFNSQHRNFSSINNSSQQNDFPRSRGSGQGN